MGLFIFLEKAKAPSSLTRSAQAHLHKPDNFYDCRLPHFKLPTSDLRQRLLQVGNDVVYILKTNRQTNDIRSGTGCDLLLR